eukprot:12405164-Alexandrium_andersonii.AAC.1
MLQDTAGSSKSCVMQQVGRCAFQQQVSGAAGLQELQSAELQRTDTSICCVLSHWGTVRQQVGARSGTKFRVAA